ncbi:unnamed protein product [Ambrosiozyma monospora]|uniref:Ribonuclease P protein subunit n=1 Tax=Ambrosiozyma monospora TaxID=43982 RepID=A0A9W6YQV1_AMBMO|nr:unnamed protein product [Ambrosiozyma monospora]
MDRKNAIERLLLTRCSKYQNDHGQLLELLENRYSLTGSQKNYLVLQSTDGGLTKQEIENKVHKKKKKQKSKTISIIHSISESSAGNADAQPNSTNKYHPLKTRNEFKQFIKSNLKYQDTVTKRLKKLQKTKPQLLKTTEDLADLQLCSKVLKFEDFIQINELWNKYISELIGTSNNIQTITNKLSSCEFIGALLTVTHSQCVDNIGMSGIVIWESQFNYVIVVPRKNNWKTNIESLQLPQNYSLSERIGGMRLIAKKNTRFEFSVPTSDSDDENVRDFELIGDRMTVRSVDRANKKFKSHAVRDIEL